MKKFSTILSLLFSLVGVSCCFAESAKIGISVPLTGPAATYGTDVKNIIVFLNERLGPKKFSLVIEDDKCDPKEAATIAQKMTEIDKVSAVVGLPCSGTVLASAPIYERAKTVAISAGAGAASISEAGDYIFRARPSDIVSAELLASHISSLHHHVGVLAEETEVAQGLADAFVKASGQLQITRESFLPNDSDVSTVLLKLRSAKVDSLLLFAQAEGRLAIAVHSLRKLGWDVATYSSIFPGSPTFLKLVGANAEGIVFSTLPNRQSLSTDGLSLLREFESKQGPLNSVDYIFPVTVAAFTSVQSTVAFEDPKKELYARTFPGLLGPFTYDASGDLVGMNYVLMRISDGKPVLVK